MTAKSRYWIFLAIAVAVALPLLLNARLKHQPSEETKAFFAAIDTLPERAVLMISFDHESSTFAETRPLSESILRHAFRKNLRVVALSLFAEGTALGEQLVSATATDFGRRYGDDYVYLGFRPQYTAAMLSLGESITGEFPIDYFGDSTRSLPVLTGVANYDDVALLISVADGSMPTYWVEYAVAPHQAKLYCAMTATMATSFTPYLSSGQIQGIISGLKGAAEYEVLLGIDGGGGRGLLAQSVAQLAIVGVILLGNLIEYVRRRRA